MLFFKDKNLVKIENVLRSNKVNIHEKLEAVAEYFIYMRNKNQKKEGDFFLEIIKAFKEVKNSRKIYIGKDLLLMWDKKYGRLLLNYEFLQVMNVFTNVQMTIFASTMESLAKYLDIFVTENGEKLRFDFKNIMSTYSIDYELFKKRANMPSTTQIMSFLSVKNIFILDNITVPEAKSLDAKFFYDMIPYMGEKVYPVYKKVEDNFVIDYMSARNIERYISDYISFMPYGQFLELNDKIIVRVQNCNFLIPQNLLNRNSNFYIVDNL